MLRIGITGGIGSGKSTVSRLFGDLGIPVIDADEVARAVVEPGTPALADIVNTFGTSVLTPEGRLDRTQLRDVVFADPERRQTLETLLHPRIRTEMLRQAQGQSAPYVVFVIPLLVEKGWQDMVDRILVVDASEEEQIARTVRRDGIDPEQARRILASQARRDERLAMADDVIENRGSPEALQSRVQELDTRYRLLAGE